MTAKINPILMARLRELAHNFLHDAHEVITQFNLIIGTGYDGDQVRALLTDFFKQTNEGKWTPEMVSILRQCAAQGDYPQVIKLYVKDFLQPTLNAVLPQ